EAVPARALVAHVVALLRRLHGLHLAEAVVTNFGGPAPVGVLEAYGCSGQGARHCTEGAAPAGRRVDQDLLFSIALAVAPELHTKDVPLEGDLTGEVEVGVGLEAVLTLLH